jgi:hypothetical protein
VIINPFIIDGVFYASGGILNPTIPFYYSEVDLLDGVNDTWTPLIDLTSLGLSVSSVFDIERDGDLVCFIGEFIGGTNSNTTLFISTDNGVSWAGPLEISQYCAGRTLAIGEVSGTTTIAVPENFSDTWGLNVSFDNGATFSLIGTGVRITGAEIYNDRLYAFVENGMYVSREEFSFNINDWDFYDLELAPSSSNIFNKFRINDNGMIASASDGRYFFQTQPILTPLDPRPNGAYNAFAGQGEDIQIRFELTGDDEDLAILPPAYGFLPVSRRQM